MPPSVASSWMQQYRVAAGARDRLRRVCRYALRPPIAQDRIRLTAEGDVLLELRHRWSDGRVSARP